MYRLKLFYKAAPGTVLSGAAELFEFSYLIAILCKTQISLRHPIDPKGIPL